MNLNFHKMQIVRSCSLPRPSASTQPCVDDMVNGDSRGVDALHAALMHIRFYGAGEIKMHSPPGDG